VNATYPSSAGVKYNADTREMSWSLGDIAAGTGFSSSPKEFAYKVSFLPSLGQVNKAPVIITKQSISGKDTFTGIIVQQVSDDLDTKIDHDASFKYGQEKVVAQ
jgi:hypothetical protein